MKGQKCPPDYVVYLLPCSSLHFTLGYNDYVHKTGVNSAVELYLKAEFSLILWSNVDGFLMSNKMRTNYYPGCTNGKCK